MTFYFSSKNISPIILLYTHLLNFIKDFFLHQFLRIKFLVSCVTYLLNFEQNWQKCRECEKLEWEGKKDIQAGESHINKGTEKHKSHSFISPKKFQHFVHLCELKWQIPAPGKWPQIICQSFFILLLSLQGWSPQRLNILISNLTSITPVNQCLLPIVF